VITSLITTVLSAFLSALISCMIPIPEGAPSWYGKPSSSDYIASYGYAIGGHTPIAKAQEEAYAMMKKQIIEATLSATKSVGIQTMNGKENELIRQFCTNDVSLDGFIRANAVVAKQETISESSGGMFSKPSLARAYIKIELDTDKLIAYENARMQEIAKALGMLRSENAFKELEQEAN